MINKCSITERFISYITNSEVYLWTAGVADVNMAIVRLNSKQKIRVAGVSLCQPPRLFFRKSPPSLRWFPSKLAD